MTAPEQTRSEPVLAPGMQVTPTVRLTEPLREGGMGAVWLADHTSLKTKVVVKFMLGELGSSESARLRFSREAAAAAKVKSPHVVQMHDHGVTDGGLPFIVMEYLEGHDLGKELQQHGALAPARVVVVVSQVAKALAKVHAAGLLHRDIKPDNIFLVASDDDEVFVKLLDFGIAKSHTDAESTTMDGQTKTGQVVGTPFYMSPEQVTAQKTIDTRSDLWSLGVVTFEALTAQRPFDGPSFGALAVKIATGDPPAVTSVDASLPAALDSFFARALAREPGDRFPTAKAFAEGLRGAFEGVVSLPPGATSMSDSGPRDRSGSGTNEVGGRVSVHRSSAPDAANGEGDGSDRPSFVLASTLAKSEHGLEVDGARTAPDNEAKKSTPKVAIFIAAIVIVAAGFFAIKVLAPDGAPPVADPTKKSATPPRSVGTTLTKHPHVLPAASTAPSAAPSVTPSAEPSAEASDAAAAVVPSGTAHPATTKPVTTGTAGRLPVKPTPSGKASGDPAARPSAAPSSTIDVW